MALATTMAFSTAARVSILLGRRFSRTISTARRPVANAICARSRNGAGMAAQPGNDIPSASASEFIVSAVPMVLQWPADGADAAAIAINSSSSIVPAARNCRPRQMTMPEPARSPSCQPSSIGPPDNTIAGRSAVAAAISAAGVVLSQPVVSTTPSSG